MKPKRFSFEYSYTRWSDIAEPLGEWIYNPHSGAQIHEDNKKAPEFPQRKIVFMKNFRPVYAPLDGNHGREFPVFMASHNGLLRTTGIIITNLGRFGVVNLSAHHACLAPDRRSFVSVVPGQKVYFGDILFDSDIGPCRLSSEFIHHLRSFEGAKLSAYVAAIKAYHLGRQGK